MVATWLYATAFVSRIKTLLVKTIGIPNLQSFSPELIFVAGCHRLSDSAMRRDMSYRKPAPVYVPSPPTSPGVEPVRPAFLIDNGNDQTEQVIPQTILRECSVECYFQGRPYNPVIVVKEKPLPTVPKKAKTASDAKPPAAPRRTKVESPPVTRQSSKVCSQSAITLILKA